MNTAQKDMSAVIAEQKAYYDARAGEYNNWWLREGEFKGEESQNILWREEGQSVSSDLQAFITPADKDILELAPGTGIWSQQLYNKNKRLTLIDSSPEMLKHNPVVGLANVSVRIEDILNWQPAEQYDVVFMGFWISHIPQSALPAFVENVAKSLRENGKVFFVDNKRIHSEQKPHVVNEYEEFAVRRLSSGQQFTIVKNYYAPDFLTALLKRAGIVAQIQETANFFQYGCGHKITN